MIFHEKVAQDYSTSDNESLNLINFVNKSLKNQFKELLIILF